MMRLFNGCLLQVARPSVWVIVVLALRIVPAGAQSTDDVRQQLAELKQQYEQSMLEFQQRIARLEVQLEKQQPDATAANAAMASAATPNLAVASSAANPATAVAAQQQPQKAPTVSVTELAKETAKAIALADSDTVGAKYQGQLPSEPTYDQLNEADVRIKKLPTQVNAFEFHGYFRSGGGAERRRRPNGSVPGAWSWC
jgi:maltoporin